jgi:hypothetical protein
METEFLRIGKPVSIAIFISNFKAMSYRKTQMGTATNGETRLSFHFGFCSNHKTTKKLQRFEAETMVETQHNHPLRGCTGAFETPPDTPRRRRDIETLRHEDQENQNETVRN